MCLTQTCVSYRKAILFGTSISLYHNVLIYLMEMM